MRLHRLMQMPGAAAGLLRLAHSGISVGSRGWVRRDHSGAFPPGADVGVGGGWMEEEVRGGC